MTSPLQEKPGGDFYSRLRALGYLDDKPRAVAAPPEWSRAPAGDARAARYAQGALRSESESVANAVEGTRNDTLNRAAFNLGRYVEAGHLNGDVVLEELSSAARRAGLNLGEINRTVRRAVGDGARKLDAPRLDPDYGVPQVTTIDDAEKSAAHTGIVQEVDWRAEWDREIEEDWIVEPIIAVGRGTALYSPPKVGKSLLMLELAACIATGKPVWGMAVRPRGVLYVDFENLLHADIIPRLKDMGFTASELTPHLHYLSLPSIEYLDTAAGGARLTANAVHYGADVVVIDTVSRSVEGEENSNDTWRNFYNYTGFRLKQAGIGYVRIDHTGKDESKGQRGGSAKSGDVDLIWRFSATDTPDAFSLKCEAKRMPVSDGEFVVVRHTTPLRHEAQFGSDHHVWALKVRACMEAMDEIGLAPNAGSTLTRKSLREAGKKAENRVIAEAIRRRKEAGNVTALDL